MEKHIVRIDVDYLGNLNCKVTHSSSGQSFLTDAPLDNQGKAEYISPTDLLVASIASCISTIMGIKANQNDINIDGMKVEAFKEMANEPYRRISKISLKFLFPNKLDDKQFKLLSNVVKICPVTKSISPDVELDVTFDYL